MKKLVYLFIAVPLISFSQSVDEVDGSVDQLLDAWHHAAATADEDVFFGLMAEDCIYLGTDPSERWTRQEFYDWGLKYFQRDSAWVFHPQERHVYYSADSTIAWFEENLDTWMGECRGSGVLTKKGDGWRLQHYNLAVLIENELIEEYKEVKGIE